MLARRALANGINASADDVIVTHGCIEALNLALRAVARPGDTIAVESPCYFGLLQILESLGMRALEIPTSPQHGLSIEALDLAFQTHGNIRAVVVAELPESAGLRDAGRGKSPAGGAVRTPAGAADRG